MTCSTIDAGLNVASSLNVSSSRRSGHLSFAAHTMLPDCQMSNEPPAW